MVENQEAPAIIYNDDDLVYVDPELKSVVSKVEFDASGRPKSKKRMVGGDDEALDTAEERPSVKGKDSPKKRGGPRRKMERAYPWGTYRSMKKIYKLEGKIPRVESNKTLDDVMEKALKEPFWD